MDPKSLPAGEVMLWLHMLSYKPPRSTPSTLPKLALRHFSFATRPLTNSGSMASPLARIGRSLNFPLVHGTAAISVCSLRFFCRQELPESRQRYRSRSR